MSCLAKTAEKMLSFSIGKCVFKDSLQFLGKSLSKCVESLAPEHFSLHNAEFAECNSDLQTLLRQKGIMPYDWLDCEEKLDTTELPPHESFFSKLTKTECSLEDYARAQRVWTLARCKTMRDYVLLYMKTDVVLLADVMESFRSTSYEHYGLDAVHYYTLPGFSWDAGLKMTGAVIGCLYEGQPDAHEMLDMLQRGVRGGVSVVSTRYAAANNPYLSGFDSSQQTSYIMNWDANNLYGGAMCEALPCGNYSLERIYEERDAVHEAQIDESRAEQCVDDACSALKFEDGVDAMADTDTADAVDADAAVAVADADADTDYESIGDDVESRGWSECDDVVEDEPIPVVKPVAVKRTTAECLADVLALDNNGERGCFLEVDLHIPLTLHDELNDYPPAPETSLFDPSPIMAQLHTELGLPKSRVPKLIPNLCDKKHYVLHFRALQTYVRLGCVVIKIHQVLWFRQVKLRSNSVFSNNHQFRYIYPTPRHERTVDSPPSQA
jgi:hypothetical protein